MATSRYYICTACSDRQWVPRLFDALRCQASTTLPPCDVCGQPTYLELRFQFGLDAGDHPCKVLAAFLPKTPATWRQEADNSNVEFFPFLVIVESLEEGYKSIWLPYWHLVTYPDETVKTKYGQWAPFIAADLYQSMTEQARAAGFDF